MTDEMIHKKTELRHGVLTIPEPEGPVDFGNPEWARKWRAHRESFAYDQRCACGKVITVLTQEDDCPEYYTTITVMCQKCGNPVNFDLPVN